MTTSVAEKTALGKQMKLEGRIDSSPLSPYTRTTMECIKLLSETSAWTKVASGFLFTLALLITLTLFGWMSPLSLALTQLPLLLGTGWGLKQLLTERDWWRLGVLGVLILVSVANLWGEIPSIFSGRDQGSIALAAWQLAKNGTLFTESHLIQVFFHIYGPGTALNFPGFAYTTHGALTTQFPLGYISWVAGWVHWIGLTGFAFATASLFILSGWTFFELSRSLTRHWIALVTTACLTLSFLPLWMLHFTLSEHLALALFLILSWSLVQLFNHFHPVTFTVVLLAMSLNLFTRIEGFAIFGVALILIISLKPARDWLRQRPFSRLLFPGLILAFLGLRDFFINLPFYTVIGKAAIKYWHTLTYLGTEASANVSQPPLIALLTTYGLTPYLLLGTIGLALAFWYRHKQALIVIALALPTFVYLVNAHITPDHPWMLRRYFFTLWPTFMLGLALTWHTLEQRFPQKRQKILLTACAAILCVSQWPSAAVAWREDENTSLWQTTTALAELIGPKDLVLVERLSSGSPYHLVAGPLQTILNKQAVYFFNPADLDRLDRESYTHVYLLSAEPETILKERFKSITLTERAHFEMFLPTIIGRPWIAPHISTQTTVARLYEVAP